MEHVKIKYLATRLTKVFIDKGRYGNTPLKSTAVGKVPSKRRINISWKGCYYNILPGETISYSRSNDWNCCFFKLECGSEFKIWCSRPLEWLDEHSFEEVALLVS